MDPYSSLEEKDTVSDKSLDTQHKGCKPHKNANPFQLQNAGQKSDAGYS